MKLPFAQRQVFVCLLCVGCSLWVGCGAGSGSSSNIVAAVKRTSNPLVAQVNVAAACAGEAMVEFGPDTSYGRSTSWNALPGQFGATNILVAGMRASTTYHMRADVECPGGAGQSEDLTFTTGAVPGTAPFPALQVSRPLGLAAASIESPGVELVSAIAGERNTLQAFVTDRDANLIWYYDVGPGNFPEPFKIMPNGHVIVTVIRATLAPILQEVDLAGNVIRQMDVNELGQKMQQAGFDFVPTGIHHDLIPLENGHLIVLTNFKKSFENLPGTTGTTQVVGDGIVDLDQNWNPVWAWNAFDYLDVNRHLSGLPDWTHANALVYLPADGNLLLSMRHQSWILKIDYNNGAGTGNVLWKLGYQGDFALAQGEDPSLWFSFQHFPILLNQSGSQTTLAIWDNGDYRPLDTNGTLCQVGANPIPCYSRATIFQLDESAKVANLEWAYTPGPYSIWGGSINQLSNGDVEFDANAPSVPPGPNLGAVVQEVTYTGSPQVIWEMDLPASINAYRAYRIPSLYPGVTWQY
jgi:arylsulfate sulfotransferase